ncbi:hypothetical protein LSTR_LSTR003040 [Laodelphax striatellus]|uniref:Uncharacterized protein n=1 Tax=Laodelphax striatellus TaxID=195883 RepID=A0A482XTI8_LAOST|nr:hypothetical protein LSTR_LSTR003040 [Laodelphax striatellus]
MDAESFTSNDVRKRIEQLSKSLEKRIKSKQNKSRFYFAEEDDEILDSNAMEISTEPGTWLYVSNEWATGEQSRMENHILESMSAKMTDGVASVINQSRRSYDSRTYTRPKKQPQPSTLQDSFRMDCTVKSGSPYLNPFGGPNLAHLNSYDTDSTMESSLGIIDINNLTESQQLDFEKASTEQRQFSSTPPQSLEALNVTYEKNNSTLSIDSDGPLNSTFTLDEDPETSPSTRQNSKLDSTRDSIELHNFYYVHNEVSDASNVGYSSKIVGNRLTNTDQNSTFDKHSSRDPSTTPQNSKFYHTQLPDPSMATQTTKLAKNETSSITLNTKYARSESPEASAPSYGSKYLRNQSPEPSPFCQNSKFSKKPLSESTPLVKNSRFAQKLPANNHQDVLEEEVAMNGDQFSSTLNEDSDYIMNIVPSFPSMMQSSTSLQSDSENTFEVNPNATIDKKRSSFGAARFKTSLGSCEYDTPNLTGRASEFNPNLTIDKRRGSEVNPNLTFEKRRVSLGRCENTGENDPERSNPNSIKRRISLGQGRYSTTSEESNFEVNPNATIEKSRNSWVNPNTTIDRRRSTTPQERSSEDPNFEEVYTNNTDEKRSNFEVNPDTKVENRSNFEVNPNTAVEKRSEVNPNTTIEKVNNSERNPYLTMDKRKSTIIAQQLKSSSTENVMVNNLNAKYQECLKNSDRLQELRDRLGGEVPPKNSSQVTPPHVEDILGEPVSVSTPSRGGRLSQKGSSPRFTNGGDSSSEISPISMEDCVSPRASSVPPLDGTFCKNAGDSFSKKGAKLLEGGASPLNSTFRKQALSSTFCKSAETLNNGGGGMTGGGSAESGPDEDGMSTASDSSFSSSSTHMRSVGEIQSIARLQEESLSLQNNTALRKIAWGGSDSGDGDLTKGSQTVFRKQATMSDDGNQSDHSERCSPSSERCSPTALNNNLRNVSRLTLKPLSSYSRTGGLSLQHARSVEQLPSGMSLARSKQSTTFGVKRPTVVSKQPANPAAPASMAPPSSRLPAPSKPSGIRPPTAIPRPVSRLPAPKIKTGLPRYNGGSSGQS